MTNDNTQNGSAPFSEAFYVPPELTERRQWICWRKSWNAKTQKVDKLPVSCVTGYGTDFLKAAMQVDYDTAIVFAGDQSKRLAGVGFVLMNNGIIGVDLDKCRNPENGEIEPWAAEIVGYGETYVEVSPSGTGIRIFALGGEEDLGGRTAAKNLAAQVEMYVSGRYLTVTGKHVSGTPWDVREAPRTVAALLARAYPGKKRSSQGGGGKGKRKGAEGKRQPKNAAEAVNQLALESLDLWVPVMFPSATKQATGAWRVESVDLGRPELEEALSLHPNGIKDWGVHDMGDRREGKRVATEVVAEWGAAEGIGSEQEALEWLAERLEVDLDEIGLNLARNVFDEDHPRAIDLDDFFAFLPEHKYIHVPTRELWPGASVNAVLGTVKTGEIDEDGEPVRIKATLWLDLNKPVEQMTWWPGEAMVVRDKLMADGGWVSYPGSSSFNLYRAADKVWGDAALAGPWLEHVRQIYPDDAEHILAWLAHRVQKPWEKINHALVLGGDQGIGKDTILVPVVKGVGAMNFSEVSPGQVTGRFNKFVRSVILRVSEARDRGDEVNRYAFYDHMKTLTAAPPDTLQVDEKNIGVYSIVNVCGVIFTTNDRLSGIYLPASDRRHYVAWSNSVKEDFPRDHWTTLHAWYGTGGIGHVVAWLSEHDISGFDAKAPPAQTLAFKDVVRASQPLEDAEIQEAIEELGNPDAVTLGDIAENEIKAGRMGLVDWLSERKNARTIPHRMASAGYVAHHNPAEKRGRYKLSSGHRVIYVRAVLDIDARLEAVTAYRKMH